MATPRAAEHRDLEARFRKLERKVRELASAALRRDHLRVSDGDFVVSGGGDVIVEDDGQILSTFPDGSPAAWFGPYTASGGDKGHGVQVVDPAGNLVFGALHYPDQPGHPGGDSVLATGDMRQIITQATDTYMYRSDFGAGLAIDSAGVGVFGGLDADDVTVSSFPTTSDTANVYMGPSGRLYRTTSSRRYKRDIRPEAVDVDAALALEPRRFVDKSDGREHVGFIAEEAHALGLDDWVEQGDSGPESFAYGSWCVALQAVCRAQQERIVALEERLTALESVTDNR